MAVIAADKVRMKVVLLGACYSGKSSLFARFRNNNQPLKEPPMSTIGSDFTIKRIKVSDRTITLTIWDTQGIDRCDEMNRTWYQGAKAAVICYDPTNIRSFEKAVQWARELKELLEWCALYLCGTRKDLVDGRNQYKRQVDLQDVMDFAYVTNAQVFEISSETGENINELLYKIAEDYAKDERNFFSDQAPEKIHAVDVDKSQPGCKIT